MNILQAIMKQPLRAAETEAGSDVETVKRKLAEHLLLDSAGAVVEDEEQATGISYKIVKDKDSGEAVELPAFTYQHGQNADTDRMLALFGAKTLCTNESSQARNGKESASAEGQMEAVSDRFAILATGKWVDRTREGVGAKIDKSALAQAYVNCAAAEGQTKDYATVLAKLEADPKAVALLRSIDAVKAEYAKLAGKPQVVRTLSDALGAI